METRNGRDVWLIEATFLEQYYPFVDAGENDMVTSRANAGQMSQDNKALQRKWHEKKQKQHDMPVEEGSIKDESDRTNDANQPDRHDGIHEENKKLWDLVTNLQEQVAKKDEQLNRYFTEQGELMKTMGRLMEQDNLLLARSQEATIASPSTKGGVTNPIDIEPTEPAKTPTKKKSSRKSKTTKEKLRTTAKPSKNEEVVVEAKTAKDKSDTKQDAVKSRNWWSVFSGS